MSSGAVAEPRVAPVADRRRARPTGRAIVLVFLVIGLLLAAVYPFRTYLEQRSRLETLEREAARLERVNADLAGRVALLHDPAYLERLARECLGMVKPGEKPFVIIPEDGDPEPLPC